jgi:hypothetical protein
VKRNFVLIYELLDETMDYGFPQLTEPAALKSFILQKGVRSELDTVRNCCKRLADGWNSRELGLRWMHHTG